MIFRRSFIAICTAFLLAMNFSVQALNPATPGTGPADWTPWEFTGLQVSDLDSDVKHYTWELERDPYGPFDKIALHRFVHEPANQAARAGNASPDDRKVMFIVPDSWDSGAPKRLTEETDAYFFAQAGYDVYSIDFRPVYIPKLDGDGHFSLLGLQDSWAATADWRVGVFRDDLAAAMDLAKMLSGADEVFMVGRGTFGTLLMLAYAATHWEEDLKGLISLDGGALMYREPTGDNIMTEAEFEQWLADWPDWEFQPLLRKQWALLGDEMAPSQNFFKENIAIAAAFPESRRPASRPPLTPSSELPLAPAPDGFEVRTVAELLAHELAISSNGNLTNYYQTLPDGSGDTYMSAQGLVNFFARAPEWWPMVQQFELMLVAEYENVPFLDYDNTDDITLPVFHMLSEYGNMTCRNGDCANTNDPHNTASQDITVQFLPNYGRYDLFAGTRAVTDVKQPLLDWMNQRL